MPKLWCVVVCLFLLTGCSWVWSHRPDCVMGLRSDGCAEGTAGYEQVQQAQAQASAIAANDDAQCQSYGAAPGSPAYVECRTNLANQHAAAQQQNNAIITQYLLTHH
jgi:hypothetical protein